MALNDNQKADLVFKKVAADKTTSSVLTAFFEELVTARKSVFTTDIWSEADQIPTTAPAVTGGVVEVFEEISLTHIPGSNSLSFYDPLGNIRDIIPFNFGDGSSYIYQLKKDNNSTIPFGLNDWYFDPDGGVLTFFAGFPSGVSPTLPPKITCWKYVGAKGLGAGSAGGGTDSKESVQYCTTGDIPSILSASQATIEAQLDKIEVTGLGLTNPTLVNGDRILVKDQIDKKENGIYVFNGFNIERATDQNGTPPENVSAGNFTFVEQGVTCKDTGWLLKGLGILTIGVDNLEWTQFTGTGSTILGIPSDGGFGLDGFVEGEISGIAPGDTMDDAFDKIESILALLAPPKPPNLSAVSMTMSSTWNALEHITGTPTVRITENTSPTGVVSTPFADASTGTITATLDAVPDGTITFTTGDDSGASDGGLLITSESILDGFWQQATAEYTTTTPISPGTITHTYAINHSITGSTSLDFHVDNVQVIPTLTVYSTIGVHLSGKAISGVPTLSTSDTIESTFDVDNAVSYYYHLSRIARVESPYVTNSDVPYGVTFVGTTDMVTSPPTLGDTASIINYASTVSNGVYTEDATLTYFGQNSRGDNGSIGSGSTNIRIDTVSNETIRLKSATGTYPALSFSGTTATTNAADCGSPYNSNESLTLNEELQLLNGVFRYPPAVNYASNLPTAGPDYSSLSGTRWATFYIGSITNATDVTFNINGASGFGSLTLVNGIELYVKVDGGTGWLDANAAYPGFGDPLNDGDPSLIVGSSTATTKRISFGLVLQTGDVYVRIGLPDTSTKSFTDIA